MEKEEVKEDSDKKRVEDAETEFVKEIDLYKKKEEELVAKIIPPHKKISRIATDADVERIIAESYILRDICFTSNGMYASAYAMAHPQIEAKDPLRFFVLNTGVMVINPKIIRNTKHPIDSEEACMTFPDKEKGMFQRFHKIEVEFQSINADTKNLTTPMVEKLSGREAKIFQHEISHLNGHYCYDEDFTPDHALENNQ